MIIKSYEIKKNKSNLSKNNFYLLYGENLGLKKEIKNFILAEISLEDKNIEKLNFFENDIINNEENFYNSVYSKSLFSNKKIIIIHDGSDKIIDKITDVYEKQPRDTFLIIFCSILEKKSKLRIFFEKEKRTICIPCYLDNERDLETILQFELKKNNISLSKEASNLIIEKSNSDRNNLRNEIEKIKSYSLDKKTIEINEIKSLINFSGDYKSDILINECLCGNISGFKKNLSELYLNTVNQILLFRILSNKTQRLLSIKEQETNNNLDSLINSSRPAIFWKEKPLVKKQLVIWDLENLKKIIANINNTELLCKKNPQISKSIFSSFFSDICKRASNFS